MELNWKGLTNLPNIAKTWTSRSNFGLPAPGRHALLPPLVVTRSTCRTRQRPVGSQQISRLFSQAPMACFRTIFSQHPPSEFTFFTAKRGPHRDHGGVFGSVSETFSFDPRGISRVVQLVQTSYQGTRSNLRPFACWILGGNFCSLVLSCSGDTVRKPWNLGWN